MDLINTLTYYFSFSFVVYAMIVGVLVALCSSLLGATLVLKRFSYIGDGLSHIAFGSIAIASVLNITEQNLLAFPVTALCAVLLLRIGQNAKVNGDAAIAMLSVGSLAVGYLLLNVFSVSSNVAGDVCTTLFGTTSILTLTKADVITCIILSIVVIIIFILFYNKIFSVTFDETFAKATGINVGLYNLLIAIVIAAVIVVAMNLVGSLLVSALVVFPALSSMRLFHNFRAVILSSVFVSIFCACSGILVSIIYGTPVGSTIVTANIVVFAIAFMIEKIR